MTDKNKPTGMAERDIIAHHNQYTEGWNNHDPETVMAAFAEGGTVSDPATDGVLSGKEIGEWVEKTTRGFPDVHFEPNRRVVNEEGLLFVEWTMTGTHDGSFGPLPPTGRSVELDGVDVVTVADDGITSINGYFDMGEFRDQLGLTFPTVVGQLPTLAVGAVRTTI
jgi:steroid delta-isomerase-like uncharacterized protein